MKIKFDVTAQELEIVQQVLKAALPAACRVWVFGSRAKHQAKHNSDLDLAIECQDKLDNSILMQLETGFDESILPYSVDIVDMKTVEPYFKEIIDKQKVLFPLPTRMPELRFPEFDGEWKEKKLGEVLTVGSGKDYKHLKSGDIPVYGSGGYMLSVNDYLYEGESVCIGRKGTIDAPMFLSGKFWTVDTLFFTHKFKDVTPKHVYSIFLNINWKKHNEAGGVPSLSKSTIEKIKVFISPSITEQQKIAAFLRAVDNKLTNLRRKHELLKSYKLGLMQQLFSQLIRFKQDDGSDFPDWEDKQLGDLGRFRGGGTPSTNIEKYWQGEVPWVSSSDLLEGSLKTGKITRFITKEAIKNSATKVVPAKSILIVSRVGVGKIAVSLNDICTSQDFSNFTPHKDDIFFLGYLLLFQKNRLLSIGQGTSIKGFTNSDLAALKVKLPVINEQQKIADFLQSVDNKIDAVAKQITQLDTFKKGLLQKLFV